ncbi:hypothetical protein K470DRAFT_269199 [Piedraia hortae CBS 480.64]|uniref:Protein PNS1 n=1 Tax=Piedraia hortae CBS 480.64 TaxID=1314780 RepID=A0A6A7C422_9PEZI|nr:hypothetical protein K470DRAFT_269199 [Piedraia hortae CBS 480.64]
MGVDRGPRRPGDFIIITKTSAPSATAQAAMFSEYASRFLQQSENPLASSSRRPLDRRRAAQPVRGESSPFKGSAPLFFSTADEFPEGDADGEGTDVDHNAKEDAVALQASRRQFGQSGLTESSEWDEEDSRTENMFDVNLQSTVHREPKPEPPEPDSDDFAPTETGRESVPPTVILPTQEPPRHDVFGAQLFTLCLCTMLGAFVLVWFHTSTPKKPLGDSIYSALCGSTYMLLWDTLMAVFVALLWLALLRNFARPLIYSLAVALPVVLTGLSIYPFVASFRGPQKGNGAQDRALRWFSFVPAALAVAWTYNVWHARLSVDRAVRVLEFSTKILAASPHLVTLGFATLGGVVVWTWLWMLMFERVFLSGHFTSGGTKRFLLDANGWWLGAAFFWQYLWSLGVIAGIQRVATAAVVSQWYFHRRAVPQPTSSQVVLASVNHAFTTAFGTVCLSSLLSLLVRLPLIILPGRIASIMNMCAYWLIPSSLATLTNPLALTYAAIFSQPLSIAAQQLGQLSFISTTNPSNTMSTRAFAPRRQSVSTLLPWRLAKLLLQATRWLMSFGLGLGGWVRTARSLPLEGAGIKGSLYAYVLEPYATA